MSEHKTWPQLDAVTQAALRCKEPVFWAFLTESGFITGRVDNEDTAARVVRDVCEVGSRSELATASNSQAMWYELDNLYQAWKVRER